MRALVLINDSVGTIETIGAKSDPDEHVRAAMEREGITADVRVGSPQRIIEEARRAARSDDFDAIVAGGGDGTVNAVASVLAGTGKPLGVLPLGTRNHFAKNIGMPLPLHEACAALAGATARDLDVGDVNGHVFVNNASIGLYPRLVGQREELQRRHFRNKWIAMFFASFSVLRRFPTLRVRIVTDHQTIYRDTPFIFVGNNPYEAHLLAIGHRPCLDGGELGLYFANRSGRFATVRLALRALLGRLDQSKDFESMALTEFWLETGRRHVHVATDGEIRRCAPPLHFRSRAGELRVLLPPAFGATCRAAPAS